MELVRVGPGEPDLRRSPRQHTTTAAGEAAGLQPTWQELDEHRRAATFIHSRIRRWSLTRLFLAAVKANCNFLSTSLAFTNRAAMLVFMALAILYGAALVVVVQMLRVERLQWQYEGLQAQVRRQGRAQRKICRLRRTQGPLTHQHPCLSALYGFRRCRTRSGAATVRCSPGPWTYHCARRTRRSLAHA